MATFNLLGEIVMDDSQKFFESDIVPAMMVGWLKSLDEKDDVEVFINSPGGSVTGGLAIANALKNCGKHTTAHIAGLAASMASVIACACDEVKIDDGAFMMIHNPWGMVQGEAEDLRKEADVLDSMKKAIMGFYQSKFDRTEDQISAMMDEETWIPGGKIADFGLKAELLPNKGVQLAAAVTSCHFAKCPAAAAKYFEVQERVAAKTEPAVDWEARYKGASKRINEITAERDAMKKERDEAVAKAAAEYERAKEEFETQLQEKHAALAKANAEREQAVADLEKAKQDLVARDEHLAELEKAHVQLTGGVLTPPAEAVNYAVLLAKAKSPEEREAIRRELLKNKQH